MIKKRKSISEQEAFEKSCKDNGIELTPKGTNDNPVAYINEQGEVVYFEKETSKGRTQATKFPIIKYGEKNICYEEMEEKSLYPTVSEEGEYDVSQGTIQGKKQS